MTAELHHHTHRDDKPALQRRCRTRKYFHHVHLELRDVVALPAGGSADDDGSPFPDGAFAWVGSLPASSTLRPSPLPAVLTRRKRPLSSALTTSSKSTAGDVARQLQALGMGKVVLATAPGPRRAAPGQRAQRLESMRYCPCRGPHLHVVRRGAGAPRDRPTAHRRRSHDARPATLKLTEMHVAVQLSKRSADRAGLQAQLRSGQSAALKRLCPWTCPEGDLPTWDTRLRLCALVTCRWRVDRHGTPLPPVRRARPEQPR